MTQSAQRNQQMSYASTEGGTLLAFPESFEELSGGEKRWVKWVGRALGEWGSSPTQEESYADYEARARRLSQDRAEARMTTSVRGADELFYRTKGCLCGAPAYSTGRAECPVCGEQDAKDLENLRRRRREELAREVRREAGNELPSEAVMPPRRVRLGEDTMDLPTVREDSGNDGVFLAHTPTLELTPLTDEELE